MREFVDKSKRLIGFLLGVRQTSSAGSNWRRILSRVTLLVGFYLIIDGVSAIPIIGTGDSVRFVAAVTILWSFGYFSMIVGWAALMSSNRYPPAPARLISDILISGLFALGAFSLAYRSGELVDTLDTNVVFRRSDFLYFSAVTFSTLGFGDFRPTAAMRLVAAAQAILGNLHLGLLAGAAFYAIQSRSMGSGESHADHEKD